MTDWKTQQKIKEDKAQVTLDGKKLVEPTPAPDPEGEVLCPFCLHEGPLGAFLISTKKGFHKGLGKCPECQNMMQLRTLTAKWTPSQFAEWVYDYRLSGFWQKCKFKTFNDRLYRLGWSYEFWDRYKQLKGENQTEAYEDYILRKQQEEHIEHWNLWKE